MTHLSNRTRSTVNLIISRVVKHLDDYWKIASIVLRYSKLGPFHPFTYNILCWLIPQKSTSILICHWKMLMWFRLLQQENTAGQKLELAVGSENTSDRWWARGVTGTSQTTENGEQQRGDGGRNKKWPFQDSGVETVTWFDTCRL